jgi:ech hydrogenase subunit A
MFLIFSLIGIPLIGALFVSFAKNDKVRDAIVIAFVSIVALLSIIFIASQCLDGNITQKSLINFSSSVIDYVCLAINLCLMVVVLIFCIKYKKILPAILAIAQICLEIYLEILSYGSNVKVSHALNVDMLTIVMVPIIGIIGGVICIYAIGYMKDFQAHAKDEQKDRRSFFFAICIAFLGAMYLIVFSNSMSWMLCGWEITTVCSFLLIGYTKTEEAIKNSFLQIILNLIGGIAFSIAIILAITNTQTADFNSFIKAGISNPTTAALPLALLSLAAFTKAAQMPFHKWLLGAMVAPTPTSALLHSSTMVKAGVFLLIKLSPLFSICTFVGIVVELIGGLTFLFASIMAISQSNGKRVLAYSTIANLGLITMCAGISTSISIWAAIILIIFHAIAKSLLFLCVGTAEHHVGSRDIESFDLLFERMPKLARFMMFGAMTMFIAPFGMLVGKWGALLSITNFNSLTLIIFLAFGSAATFMYWGKWLGKLAGITGGTENIEGSVTKSENFSHYLLATLLVLTTALLPFISEDVATTAGTQLLSAISSANPLTTTSAIPPEILLLSSIFAIIVFIGLFLSVGKQRKANQRKLNAYMSGVSLNNDKRSFKGSLGNEVTSTSKNFYLENYFGEGITSIIIIFSTILILISIIYSMAIMVM